MYKMTIKLTCRYGSLEFEQDCNEELTHETIKTMLGAHEPLLGKCSAIRAEVEAKTRSLFEGKDVEGSQYYYKEDDRFINTIINEQSPVCPKCGGGIDVPTVNKWGKLTCYCKACQQYYTKSQFKK